MPKSGKRAKIKNDVVRRTEEERIMTLHEKLSRFEWFNDTVMPALQEELVKGATAEELRAKFHSLVQAQMITTALSSPDPKARLAASKDLMDRHEGTATQKIEQTHRLEKLPEEQIEALLRSELEGIESDDEVAH